MQVLRAALVALRNLKVPSDAVVLASYPKSGNTWLKMLLCAALQHVEPDFDEIEKMVPYAGLGSPPAISGTRIVKTHERPSRLYRRGVYLVRDPYAVARSYFAAMVREGVFGVGETDRYLCQFFRGKLDNYGAWGVHASAWTRFIDGKPQWYLLKYEDLVGRPSEQIQEIVQHIGKRVDDKQVRLAVEACSRENLAKAESRSLRLGRKRRTTGIGFVGGGRQVPFVPQETFYSHPDAAQVLTVARQLGYA